MASNQTAGYEEILFSTWKRCETKGCGKEVFFRFSKCYHFVCGDCLSKNLSDAHPLKSDVYCPMCIPAGNPTRSTVTYKNFLDRHLQKKLCTCCFSRKAIYVAPCQHLVCGLCLTNLSKLKEDIKCKVRGCDFIFTTNIKKLALDYASEMEMWQTFRIPSCMTDYCRYRSCTSKAKVEVNCGHRFCLSCFKKVINMDLKQKKMENKIVTCNATIQICKITSSCASAQNFVDKAEELMIMTALNIEIRISYCKVCNEKKETLRYRECDYVHTVCIDCILYEMTRCSEMSTKNKYIACKVNHCGNEIPYQCLEAMINTMKGINLMPGIFLRRSCITDECSKCKPGHKRDGFRTIIACGHALCRDCVEQLKDPSPVGKYYVCEGSRARCGYHVPLSIVTKTLEETSTSIQFRTASNQNERSTIALEETVKTNDSKHDMIAKKCPNKDPIVSRTKEELLTKVLEKETRTERCVLCNKKPVIALLKGCNHYFCECCLNTLMESSKDSVMSIDCPASKCPSFVTVKMVEQFIFDGKCSHEPHKNMTTNIDQIPLSLELHEPGTRIDKADAKLDATQIKRKNEEDVKNDTKIKMPKINKSFGLTNVGLSCYRNTILQTLAETPSFYKLLQETKTDKSPTWIALLCLILGRIQDENTGGREMLENLERFHYEFNQTNTEYRDFQQEDTLSFLNSVLNGLHASFEKSELNKEIGTSLRLKDPTSIFRGIFKSAYRCRDCNNEEYFEGETFFSLPLPIAESRSVKGKATIGSCFEAFFAEEEIDCVPCSNCESTHVAKKMLIAHFPDVLILQICKLEEATYGRDFKPYEKNSDHVLFWEDFNGLKEHNNIIMEELKKHLRHYRLLSVVEHLGSASSGHYVCYVRRQQTWWFCDDSYVKKVTIEKVKKASAYLLFYEKMESTV